MSCDENPYYLDFWPLVSRVWKERIGVDPVLVLVGDSDVDDTFGEVVKIKPIDAAIHTQAQLARLWHPINEPDTLWITSDIDMFPISRTYWESNLSKDDFVWKNLNTDTKNYFPICYNIAYGKNFKEVLSIPDAFDDFIDSVSVSFKSDVSNKPENWDGNSLENWGLDEVYVSSMVCRWRDMNGGVEQPMRPDGFHDGRRINRTNWIYDNSKIEDDFYIDCHSLRPYNKHKDRVDELLRCLLP